MRRILLFCAVLLAMLPVFSRDIVGIGTGATEEEAIAKADAALSQQIYASYSAEMRRVSADNSSKAVDSIDISSDSSDTGEFPFSDLKVKEKENGSFEAERTIKERAYRDYRKLLDENVSEINSLYSRVRRNGIDLEYYHRLLEALDDYERNSVIVSLLRDGKVEIPSIPTNSVDVETMYQSSLSQGVNTAEQRIRELEIQRELGLLSDEEGKEIEAAKAELEALYMERDTLSEIQQMEAEAERKAFGLRYGQVEIAENESLKTAASYINEIEAVRKAYRSYIDDLDYVIKNYEKQCEESGDEIEAEIKEAEYFEWEKGSLGFAPSSDALSARDKFIAGEKEKIEALYKKDAMEHYQSVFPVISAIAKMGQEAMMKLNDAPSFSASFPGQDMSCRVSGFDADSLRWNGKADLTIGSGTLTIPFHISLWDMLGVHPDDDETYYRYREEIQQLTDILQSFPYAITIDIEYSMKCYAGEEGYRVTIESFTVRNAEKGRKVGRVADETVFHLPFSSDTVFTGYVPDSYLVDSSLDSTLQSSIQSLNSAYSLITEEGEARREEERIQAKIQAEKEAEEREAREAARAQEEQRLREEQARLRKERAEAEEYRATSINGYQYLASWGIGSFEIGTGSYFMVNENMNKLHADMSLMVRFTYNMDYFNYRNSLRPNISFILGRADEGRSRISDAIGGAIGCDFIYPLSDSIGLIASAKLGGVYFDGVSFGTSIFADLGGGVTMKIPSIFPGVDMTIGGTVDFVWAFGNFGIGGTLIIGLAPVMSHF